MVKATLHKKSLQSAEKRNFRVDFLIGAEGTSDHRIYSELVQARTSGGAIKKAVRQAKQFAFFYKAHQVRVTDNASTPTHGYIFYNNKPNLY